MPASEPAPSPWWREGVFYQVYPRSFQDSDGDGVGDLPGLISRLDHLEWLGVDGIWLSPTFPSPNRDWGYDVAGYRGVHPELGTLADLDRLIAEAGRRGIKVLLDLVPNHTSDQHAWFVSSRASRDSPKRDYYVWADPLPDGAPPNNWRSQFGGSAWQLDAGTGQMYLHLFDPGQPDLNWWHEPVREEFDEILRFWFSRGIAGFRIDTAHLIVKDRQLRDNPPADASDHPLHQQRGWKPLYTADRPEVHDVLKRWRRVCGEFSPQPVLVGETYVMDLAKLPPYYGADDQLHLAFNFPFVHAPLDPAQLSEIVAQTESLLPPSAWPVYVASNHDVSRFPTRWCDRDPGLVRCVLMMLLTLRGTPFLYQGDEIGMGDGEITRADVLDPVGLRWWPRVKGRDVARTPMQWSGAPGAGFAPAGVKPWLPYGDFAGVNVEAQRADPGSVLNFCRELIALRRSCEDLRSGAYEAIPVPDGTWAWKRGSSTAVALNLGGQDAVLPFGGTVLLGTARGREGERASRLVLAPREGLVCELPS